MNISKNTTKNNLLNQKENSQDINYRITKISDRNIIRKKNADKSLENLLKECLKCLSKNS